MIRLDRRVALGAWQLVMLDSRVPERGHGHLADEELAALDEALSADAGLHTLIGLHHGPVTACPMPLCQLDNAGELFGLLRRHANARAVIAGHIHCAVEHFQDGTALLATPSTCVQARHPAGPHVPDELEFSAVHELDTTRRAYRRLELFADGGIVTEVVWDTDPA
jgi:Icc protein